MNMYTVSEESQLKEATEIQKNTRASFGIAYWILFEF